MIIAGLIFIVFLGILMFGLLLPMGDTVPIHNSVANPVTLSVAIFCVVLLIVFFALMKRD